MNFKRITQFLLVYTWIVILWGAWVRISHSGDGCGASWPLCHGQFLPDQAPTKTWIELTHRIMSGLYGILIVFYWAYSFFRKDFSKTIKKYINLLLFFTITEALLGAKLVLFGLVGQDDSTYRIFVMMFHLANSLLLSGTFGLILSHDSKKSIPINSTPWINAAILWWFGVSLLGSIASLSNTLFPVDSLMSGFLDDFSAESHLIVKLRFWHPLIATLGALFFGIKFFQFRGLNYIGSLILFQMLLGASQILWHSTTSLKLIHLFFVHFIWYILITLKYAQKH